VSHVATIDLEIKDLDCLIMAASDCGLEQRHQSTYKWYGHHVGDYPMPEGFTADELGKCDFALGVKGNTKAYEIGCVKRGGKWTLLWDFWNGGYGLQDKVGPGCCKLKQHYAKHVALKKCKKLTSQGYKLKEKTNEKGEIVLSLGR